ncbi:unnamed protein product, partial [Dovyalis caffra]
CAKNSTSDKAKGIITSVEHNHVHSQITINIPDYSSAKISAASAAHQEVVDYTLGEKAILCQPNN